MRSTVVTAGLFVLIVGTPGRLASQAASAAASEIVKMGTGAIRQSEKTKKAAQKDKKPPPKEKEQPKPAFDPALCSTSPEAYDKMIQALRQEIAAREVMKEEIAKSKVDKLKYQQCQADVASDPKFQQIMSRNPPGPSTTPAQVAQTMQKKFRRRSGMDGP